MGRSDHARLVAIANNWSRSLDAKLNTWYFNDNDPVEGINYHWRNVPSNPIWYWKTDQFERIVLPEIEGMVRAAETGGYLCFGCDGNQHRGPSILALFFCVAGVEPKESERIASKIFGRNFVLKSTRRRIAELGFEYGNTHGDVRRRLQLLMFGVEG